MNRLLKDCMNPCCCKKEENICDIIDDLGKVVCEIDCNKKIAKEIDKAIKKAKVETEEKIKEVTEEWTALLNKFNREKWVIGEYKWMPIGSKMPEGWVKVELDKGLTLVQGDAEGNSAGSLQAHYHTMFNNAHAWGVEDGGVLYFTNRPSVEGGVDGETMVFTKDNSKATFIDKTATVGTENNLAAGKFAELWQFKGVDYVANCMKKCLEKCLSECLDKANQSCGK